MASWSPFNFSSILKNDLIREVEARILNSARALFDGDTNLQVGMMRFNRSLNLWEEYTGSGVWEARGVAGDLSAYKNSDFAIAVADGPVFDTELSVSNLAANRRYAMEGFFSGNNQGGTTGRVFQYRFEISNITDSFNSYSVTSVSDEIDRLSSTSSYMQAHGEFGSADSYFRGRFATGANTGTLNVRVRTGAENNNVDIKQGSYIILRDLGPR